jgi:hypothetical protein
MPTPTFVEDRVTPVSLDELHRALASGFEIVLSSAFPSAEAMACGAAQLRLECGNGAKNHLFNFHNEKLGPDWDGLYTQYRCDELFDAQTTTHAQRLGPTVVSKWKDGPLWRVVLIPPHPWSSFVAFENATEGAARYIEFLSCRERYRKAWHALYSGDVRSFGHELRAAGYFTADEETYTRGLVQLASESLPACRAILAGDTHTFTPEEITNTLALVEATVAETIWNHGRHDEQIVA